MFRFRNSQYGLSRIATLDVECNTLSPIAKSFSSEEMTGWLRKGLTARDVNRILRAIGQAGISAESADKVAGCFNALAKAYPTSETEQNSNSFRTEKGDIDMPDSTTGKSDGQAATVQPSQQQTPPQPPPDNSGDASVFIGLLIAALVAGGIYWIRHKTSSKPRPTTASLKPKPPKPKPEPPKPPAPPENAFRIPTENERLIEFCQKTCPEHYRDGNFYFTESIIEEMDGDGCWTKKIAAEIAEKSGGRIEMIWPEKGAEYSADEMDRDEPYTRPCRVVKVLSPGMRIDGKIIRKAIVKVTDNYQE